MLSPLAKDLDPCSPFAVGPRSDFEAVPLMGIPKPTTTVWDGAKTLQIMGNSTNLNWWTPVMFCFGVFLISWPRVMLWTHIFWLFSFSFRFKMPGNLFTVHNFQMASILLIYKQEKWANDVLRMPLRAHQCTKSISKILENSTANDPARPKVEPNKLLQVAPARFVELQFQLASCSLLFGNGPWHGLETIHSAGLSGAWCFCLDSLVDFLCWWLSTNSWKVLIGKSNKHIWVFL